MQRTDRRNFLKGAASTATALAFLPEWSLGATRLPGPVRVGLIGAGRQGRALLGELAKFEDVTVVSLCDTDERRLSSASRRAPEAKTFATHAELLEGSEVDAIVVATPTHEHRTPAQDAMAAGKHVYCEAPLAHTAEDARALALAAKDAPTVFQTGMQGRSNPIYALARSFVRSGAIRDLTGMRAQRHEKTSWRAQASDPAREKALNWKLDPAVSTGLVGEWGTHQFDVLHWFTGQYPTSVQARGGVHAWQDGREVADTVQAEFAYPGERVFAWDATLGNSFEGEYELLCGTMGAVKLAWTAGWLFKEADAPTQGWEVYANRQQFHDEEGITLIADATKLAAQGKLKEGIGLPHPPLYYALESFLKSVTEDQDVVCTAQEGLRATVVATAAHRALLSGERVTIDEADFQLEER